MPIELKKTIQELGETFHEFKKSIDDRVKLVEKGEGIGEVDAKLEEMNDKLDQLDALKGQIEELETKSGRISKTTEEQHIADHAKGFNDFMRKGSEDGLRELEKKAVNVGTNADGGFAVPETLDTEIGKYAAQANPMRALCRVIQVSNENYKKLFNIGGTASGWVGETAARPETASSKLAAISPVFGEIYANPATTQNALDDLMFNVESWIAEEVGQEFAEQENAAYTVGAGANMPKGLMANTLSLLVDGSRAFGEIQYRLSGTDSALGADSSSSVDNLIDLTMDLKAAYRGAAQWMMQNGVLRLARKLKDVDGNLIWQPGLQAGMPSQLLGYGVAENEDMPAVAAESNSVAFGDYRRTMSIVDVVGTRVLRDPYTNKPYVHFYTTKRTGSLLANDEAVKVLRLGNGV